jgi:hypothetical protein
MANVAATDVTYTFKTRDASELGRAGKEWFGYIAFGDAALTYPTGGIPLTKGKMGCPNRVVSLEVVETNAKNVHCEYDVSAVKLRIFAAATGTVSAPTLDIVKGAQLENSDLNLAGDAAGTTLSPTYANVLGANLTLTNPVNAPTFTGTTTLELKAGGSIVPTMNCYVRVVGY